MKLDVSLYHTYYCRDLSSLFAELDISTSIVALSSNGSRLALSTEKHLVITDDTNDVSEGISLETILEYQHDITGVCTALTWIAQDVVILGFESGDIACFDLNGVGIVEQIFDPAPIRSIQLSHKGLPLDGKYGQIDDRDSFVWILYESSILAVISVEKLLSENFEDLIKYQLLDNKVCTDFVILPKVYETNKFDLAPEQASHSILVGGEQSTYSIYNLGGPQHFEHFGKFTEYAKSKTINIVSRAFASIFGDSSGTKKTKASSSTGDSSSREGATSPSRDYEYDLVRLPMVAVASVLDFTDEKRKVIRMRIDPTGTYVAISDNLARVSLFDIRLNSIVNLWKGVRDSWVAWSYSKAEGLHLGIYGPRLGLLSTYSIPDGHCTMTAPVGVHKQLLTLKVESVSDKGQDDGSTVKTGIVQLPYESESHDNDDRFPVLDILLLDQQAPITSAVEGDPGSPSKLTRGKFIHDSPEIERNASNDAGPESPSSTDFSKLLMTLSKAGDLTKKNVVGDLIAATKRVSSVSECLKVLSAVQRYELPSAAHVPIEVHQAIGEMLQSLSSNDGALGGTEIIDAIHREAKLHAKLLEVYVLLRELALHRSETVADEISLEQVMDARAGGLREAVGYNLRALKLSTARSRPSFDDGSPRAQRSSGSFSSSISSTLSSSLHRGDEAWPSSYHHTNMARSPLASSLVKSPSFRSGYLPKDSMDNSDEVSVASRGSSFSSHATSRQGSFSDSFVRLELRSNSLIKGVLNTGKMLPDTSADITFSSFRLFLSMNAEGELFVRSKVLQQVVTVLNDRVNGEGKSSNDNDTRVVYIEIDQMAALDGTQQPEFSVQYEVKEAVLLSYVPFLSLPFTCDCSDTAMLPEIIKMMASLGLFKGADTFCFLAVIMPQAISLHLSSQDFLSRVLLPRIQDGNPFCHFLREAILILYQEFEEQLHLIVGSTDGNGDNDGTDDPNEFKGLPQAIARLIVRANGKSIDAVSHFDDILRLYLSEMAFSLQQLSNLELAMGICALVSEVLEDVEVEIRNRMLSQFTVSDETMSVSVLTASKKSWKDLFSRLRVNIHLSVRHGKALSLAQIDTHRQLDDPLDRSRYPPRSDRASIYQLLAEDTLRFALTGVAARAHEQKCKNMFAKKHKSSSSWRDAPLKIYGNIADERSDDFLLLLEADDARETLKKSALGDVSPLTKDSTLSPAATESRSGGYDTPSNSNSGKSRRRRPLLLLFPSHSQSVPLAWQRGLLLCQRWRETMTDTYLLSLVAAHLETLNRDLRGIVAFELIQRYLFPIVRGASLLGENCPTQIEDADSQKFIALLASFSASTSNGSHNLTTPPTVRLPLKNQGDIFDVMQGAMALHDYITKANVPIDATNRQVLIDRLRLSIYTTNSDVDVDDWIWPSHKDPSLEAVLDGYTSSTGKDIQRCSDVYVELLLTQHLRFSCHLRGVSASQLLGSEKWSFICNDFTSNNDGKVATVSEEADTKNSRIEFLRECFSRVNEESSISFIYALGRHWDVDRATLMAEQVYIYVGRGLDADVLALLSQSRGYEPTLLSAVLNALRKRIGNTYERLKYSQDNSHILGNVDKDCLDFVMKVVDVELDGFVRDAIAKKELPTVDIDIGSSNSIAMSVYQTLQKVSVTQQSTLEYKKLTTKCNALLILLRSLAKAT